MSREFTAKALERPPVEISERVPNRHSGAAKWQNPESRTALKLDSG
jgi:hypothetical protein